MRARSTRPSFPPSALAVWLLASPAAAQTFSAPAFVNGYGPVDDGVISVASSDDFPDTAAAGTTTICAWDATRLPGAPANNLNEIGLSRSTDGGATWSPAFGIGDAPNGHDRLPNLASDGNGNWLLAWNSNQDLAGTAGPDDDIYFARSSNDGVTWSAPAHLNTDASSDSVQDVNVVIAGSAAGTWVAVWRRTNPDADVQIARSIDGGITWSPSTALNSWAAGDTAFDDVTGLATDGAGNWIAAWRSNHPLAGGGPDYDIWYVRSTDDAASWSAPALLDTGAPTDTLLDFAVQVATDAAGVWVALWSSEESGGNRRIVATRSLDAGMTWSSPFQIAPTASFDFQSDPDLAVGDNRWAVFWSSTRFSSSLDGGQTWSAPVNLNPPPSPYGPASRPRISVDDAGRIAAVWWADDVPHPGGTERDIFGVYSLPPPVPALPVPGLVLALGLLLGVARTRLATRSRQGRLRVPCAR